MREKVFKEGQIKRTWTWRTRPLRSWCWRKSKHQECFMSWMWKIVHTKQTSVKTQGQCTWRTQIQLYPLPKDIFKKRQDECTHELQLQTEALKHCIWCPKTWFWRISFWVKVYKAKLKRYACSNKAIILLKKFSCTNGNKQTRETIEYFFLFHENIYVAFPSALSTAISISSGLLGTFVSYTPFVFQNILRSNGIQFNWIYITQIWIF